MKNNQLLPPVAIGLSILLPLTLAFAPTGASLRFAPKEGLTLTKTFVQTAQIQLESVETRAGDDVQEVSEIPDVTIESIETIIFEDTYNTLGDGRPEKLTRHFTELGRIRTQNAQDEETITEETSELTDLTVIYGWDEDEGEFSATFAEDSEGDEDLLESTRSDADLLGFLPEGEVDEGDTWEVSVEAWRLVLEPGGDLSFLDEEGESSLDEIDEEISASLDGEIECEFKGFREDDGRHVAVIAITVEVQGLGDTETEREIEANDHVSAMTQIREVSISSEVEGELLWDIEAGHMLSLNMTGETMVEVAESMLLDLVEGGTFEQGQNMTFGSEVQIEVTFE